MTNPHDSDAELAVLGAILMQPGGEELLSKLDPNDFWGDSQATCIRLLKEMSVVGEPLAPDSLVARLRARGLLDRVGGARYVAETLAATPAIAPSRMGFFVTRLKDLSRRRKLIAFCRETIAEAEVAEDSAVPSVTLADSLCSNVMAVRSDQEGDTFHTIKDSVKRFAQGLDEKVRALAEGKCVAPSTGIGKLDRALGGGLLPKRLIILAARPSMGKTSFAIHLASAANATKSTPRFGVHVISLETSDDRLSARFLGMHSKLDTSAIMSADMTPDQWRKLSVAAQEVSSMGITFDDRPEITIAQLRASIRRAQVHHARLADDGSQESRLGVVMVDYLQLVSAGLAKGSTREQEVTAVATALQAMAKEFNVCIIALSQLNRGVEARDNKRPLLKDLRESGGIEQAADVILGLYREEYYAGNRGGGGITEVLVLKSKEGPTGMVKVSFRKDCMAFAELEESDEPW